MEIIGIIVVATLLVGAGYVLVTRRGNAKKAEIQPDPARGLKTSGVREFLPVEQTGGSRTAREPVEMKAQPKDDAHPANPGTPTRSPRYKKRRSGTAKSDVKSTPVPPKSFPGEAVRRVAGTESEDNLYPIRAVGDEYELRYANGKIVRFSDQLDGFAQISSLVQRGERPPTGTHKALMHVPEKRRKGG